MRFVLATANPDKAREITQIVGDRLELVSRPPEVPDVAETGSTLVDNARLKARALAEATGLAAIADDTGLEVEALGGAPGVYSARYGGDHATYADNVAKLLEALHAQEGRRARAARFVTAAVAIWPDGTEVTAEGSVSGWIAAEARGSAGFGYDPVFVPAEGDGRSFAELMEDDPEAKNRLSHRAKAFEALLAALAAT